MFVRSARLAALGCLFCQSAGADPSAECPKGWFCEAPPEAARSRGPEALPPSSVRESEPSALSRAPLSPDAVEEEPEPAFAAPDPQFGVHGRLGVALVDDGDSPAHPFMAGVGLGFLFLPLDFVGVELSVDSGFGRDALDAERRELAVSAALRSVLNPREPVQVFVTTGLFHSWARVDPGGSQARDYRYFGAVLGLGAELAFQRLYAATAQIDGFIRGRVDAGAAAEPEFVNETTGETSNTSAGMLLRLGAIRYF
jgi:hypothetical protein